MLVCRVAEEQVHAGNGPVRLAIDMGTSHTVAVVHRAGQQPRALLFDGSPLLPSGVYAGPGGDLHTGRDAERLAQVDPAGFDPNPKRTVDHDTVLLGRHEFAPSVLLGAVLGRVARAAAEAGGSPHDPAVLTCPADWGRRRRGVLLEAAARADIRVAAMVDEPIAAATYCLDVLGRQVPVGQSLVVFDFGGGTLDVAAVRREPDGLRVLATGGLADLGGLDVDAALVGQLGQLLAVRDEALWHRLSHPTDAAALRDRRAFWSEVRAAKEMLSRTSSAPVQVPGTGEALHLTREELERVAGPLVDRAVDETRRLLRSSGVGRDDLAGIFLVGGSSRMPLVASKLHTRLGVAPAVPEQPELPVAYGALLAGRTADAALPPSTRDEWGPEPSDWVATTADVRQGEPAPAGTRGAKASRGRLGRRWLAAGAVVVVLLAGGAIWRFAGQGSGGGGAGQGVTGQGASSEDASGRGGGDQGGKGKNTAGSVPAGFVACGTGQLCPTTATCWAGLVINGGNPATARKLSCQQPHSWETFVVGHLADDEVDISNDDLVQRPDIVQLCSAATMDRRSVDRAATQGWQWAVLPEKVSGVRLVHCVARPAVGGDTTGAAFRAGQ